jgi:hypothetical protein
LPRSIAGTGKGWLIAVRLLAVWIVVTLMGPWANGVTDRSSAAILRAMIRARVDWPTMVFENTRSHRDGVDDVLRRCCVVGGDDRGRQRRHVFTSLAGVFVLELITILLITAYQRPPCVRRHGDWALPEFSLPRTRRQWCPSG